MGHLYRSLADYHFRHILLKQEGEVYAYELIHESEPKQKMPVAWSPEVAARIRTTRSGF